MKAKKLMASFAAMAMTATALTSAMSASALEGAGTYTGNAAFIGSYQKSGYFGNTAFQVTYKYDSFDEDGTYTEPGTEPDTEKEVTIDYNDTFQFLVFDSAWGGWDATSAGPDGVNDTEEPLTKEDLVIGKTYTTTVDIATIEKNLSTTNPVQGINLQLGGVGDTTVTVESIEYVAGDPVEAGEVTITGEWVKGTGGTMTVEDGTAYVSTNEWNIQVSKFVTTGFVNPTVDVTVTYETAPNDFVQAELQTMDGTPIVANYPDVDVTGTYTYTTEIPSNVDAFMACYDQCTVKEIHIYDNHEGKALDVSGQTASVINSALQPGFALGGALDASDDSGDASETAWGNPVVTEVLFQTIKSAGFKSVRIPISYLSAIDANGDIDDAYIGRIQAVVDRALDTGLYVVIDIHGDGSDGVTGKWIDISLPNGSAEFKAIVAKFSAAWTEIAKTFANYNQALIFESMNEVMVSGKYYRNQFTDDEFANIYANIVELNQAFVDAVRGTGNDANDDRCLIVPGYNTDIDLTLDGFSEGVFSMPDDIAKDRLMLSVHYYTPSNFTLDGQPNDTNVWDINGQYGKSYMVSQLTNITEYDYPVYIGEYGAMFKNDIPEVVEYVGAFNDAIDEVADTGKSISAAYWDNGVIGVDAKGSGLIDRRFNIVTSIGKSIIAVI